MAIITNIIAVFLITVTGISSSTTAEIQVPREQSAVFEYSGFSNHNILSNRITAFMELLKEQCERNGGPYAYDNIRQAQKDFTNYFKSTLPRWMPSPDASLQTKADFLVAALCPRMEDIKYHFNQLTNATKACYESKYHDALAIRNEAKDSMLDFVCANDGQWIKKFIIGGGLQCATMKMGAIKECIQQVLSSYSFGGDDEPLHELPPPLGIEHCNTIDSFRRCTVGALEQCEQQDPAYELDALFNLFVERTRCNDLLESVSSSVDVSALSITASMAIAMSAMRFA